MGRNPELIEKKKRRGTVRPVREAGKGNLPVVSVSFVKPPTWMPKDQRKTFKRITEILREWGILSEADLGIVEAYVSALHNWREDQLLIQQKGAYVPKIGPNGEPVGMAEAPWSVSAKAWARIIKDLGTQLGFSPVARARILSLIKPDEEEKDDFAEFVEV